MDVDTEQFMFFWEKVSEAVVCAVVCYVVSLGWWLRLLCCVLLFVCLHVPPQTHPPQKR